MYTATSPFRHWDLPENIEVYHKELESTIAIQQGPYAMIMEVDDSTRITIIRYDLEAKQDDYERALNEIYPRIKFIESESKNLPDHSKLYYSNMQMGDEAGVYIAMVPDPKAGIRGIVLNSQSKNSYEIYHKKITAIAYGGIPSTIILNTRPKTLDFIGREFNVNSVCQLKGIRNLSCYPNGQMNWEIHNSLEEAKAAAKTQYKLTVGEIDGEIYEDIEIDILFEGVPTKARRVTFSASNMMPFPSALMFNKKEKTLVAYYIAAEVRGLFAHCVYSHYKDQEREGGLAPLGFEIISFPEENKN
jgi:hypothetical protein